MAAVDEAELAALMERAPADAFAEEELRYMLSRTADECAEALPEITASMAKFEPDSEDFAKLAFLGEFVASRAARAAEGSAAAAGTAAATSNGDAARTSVDQAATRPAEPAPSSGAAETRPEPSVQPAASSARAASSAAVAAEIDEIDDEALLAVDIDQARADAAAATASASAAASSSSASGAPANLPPQMLSADERARERTRLQAESEAELRRLRRAQSQQKRDADTVTDEMYAMSKQLLRLFGVPFVVAPMEAEAQCAQLERCGAVDGVVSEDNDTFLFGGRHVYKHLFDANRQVEAYHMDDVEAELSVRREQMVDLALLLGSDYTDGVNGVGIVNAMEVLSAFTDDAGGLKAFKQWVSSWRGDADADADATDESELEGGAAYKLKEYKRKHRKMRRNWTLPDDFPSKHVIDAYLKPHVDTDEQPCQWERPDLQGLREFCSIHFNWPQAKADEHLLPVMKAFEVTTSQTRIDSFFSFEHRFARFDSSRLAAAIPSAQKAPPNGQAATVQPRGRGRGRGRAQGRGRAGSKRGRGRGRGKQATATIDAADVSDSDEEP